MQTAERLVDEGKRSPRGTEEERIVVTSDKLVEACQLERGETAGIPWRNMPVLHLC